MNQGLSLNDLIYARMNRDIMNLTLEPGTAVSVQKLADLYRVSRTPVREAVIRLEKKGLVEIFPQAKTVISRISMKRIRQECFIRKALEIAAVKPFIYNCDEAAFDKLRNILLISKIAGKADEDYYRFFCADNNFHRLIFETANEALSWATISDVVSHYNRFRFLSTKIKGVNQAITDEHEKIISAAQCRDEHKMKAILEEHLGKIKQEIGSLLEVYPQYFAENE